ncbi:MAG TPA: Ig-like domain-containing protein, partial [Longimicrobiaceae bacterium]
MRLPFLAVYGAVAALGAAALASTGGCAHVEAPPGGEPDSAAPRLESTRPDTFARLRSYLGAVVFQYDEGLSERGVDTIVTVSPRTSAVVVDKGGSRLNVSLRRGWEPNRVYQVTVHPGLADLFGNVTREPQTLVFSTGPEIIPTVATGTAVLRTTLEPARGALVELVHRPDSVLYETRPDSAGRWTVMYLPEGEYLVRAYNDTNHDQKLQPYEARDTTVIRVARRDTARARRLALLAPDSTAPKAGTATGEGDVVEVRFDDYLDPAQALAPSQVTITGAGGAAVPVAELRVGPFPDTARADSTR